ncbi:MAG: hypothetical protein IJW14_00870 [Oscillospiraceae bacterium]|nr:hypothetical protein [Oscillospiraceae bacterium]
MKKKHLSGLLCLALTAVYLLGIHEGKVALWRGDDPEPLKVFPYSASSLPEDARKQLEAGVTANSLKELRQLVEDYLS